MCRGVDVCCFGRNQTGFRPKQHTSTPDAGDSTGEVGHETVMIDGQCDVYAGHGRVDEAGRIADGAAACAVEIARLRLDLHRQIEAFHQTWIQCDGRGKGIMQWHACREETRIRMKIRCDREIGDIGKERPYAGRRSLLAPLCGRVASQQTLVCDVQSYHGHVRAGMEHTIRRFRILDDVRFGGRIPAVSLLGERPSHHHQP